MTTKPYDYLHIGGEGHAGIYLLRGISHGICGLDTFTMRGQFFRFSKINNFEDLINNAPRESYLYSEFSTLDMSETVSAIANVLTVL